MKVEGWIRLETGRQIEEVGLCAPLVIDVETVSPDVSSPNLAKNPHKAILADVFLYSSGQVYVVCPELLADLKDKLYSYYAPDFVLVGQNFRFDLIVLKRHGLDLTEFTWEDIIHYDHLVDATRPHDLASIIKREFDFTYKDDFWDTYSSYLDAPEEVRCAYGANDVYWEARAYEKLRNQYTSTIGARKAAIEESLKHGNFGNSD